MAAHDARARYRERLAFMLRSSKDKVKGTAVQRRSHGNADWLGPPAEIICEILTKEVKVDWDGGTDHRSCRVSFDK
jgi:hypothetical protein